MLAAVLNNYIVDRAEHCTLRVLTSERKASRHYCYWKFLYALYFVELLYKLYNELYEHTLCQISFLINLHIYMPEKKRKIENKYIYFLIGEGTDLYCKSIFQKCFPNNMCLCAYIVRKYMFAHFSREWFWDMQFRSMIILCYILESMVLWG